MAFSGSDLVTEHVYPLYDYKDYEFIEEEEHSTSPPASFFSSSDKDDRERESLGMSAGLSQRLHPSLRSPEPNMDDYRYSPSREVGSNATPSLHSYKPSILSSYGDTASQYLHGGHLSTAQEEELGDKTQEKKEEEVEEDAVPDRDSADFYASLTAETAAMLW